MEEKLKELIESYEENLENECKTAEDKSFWKLQISVVEQALKHVEQGGELGTWLTNSELNDGDARYAFVDLYDIYINNQ